MQLAFEENGDVTVVRVQEAKLTYPVLSSFFSEVRQLVEGGARRVLIDLAAVSYIDSASIGCLMDIHRLLQEKGGAAAPLGPAAAGGDDDLDDRRPQDRGLHRDEEEALAAFGARRGGGHGASASPPGTSSRSTATCWRSSRPSTAR